MKAVSPYKTSLDSGNAYWMATLASEVYLSISEGNKKPDEIGILRNLKAKDEQFISVFSADKNSAQAALIEHENYLSFAFRGTDEIADWIDNINAFSTQALFGSFHRGFWNALMDVWAVLYDRCNMLQQQKKRPVFFTGHSLGGAMATIAAAHFIQQDKPFSSVYTFGQPRALTRETAQLFNMECQSRFFRFHNNNDLVTRVPARLMGYSHVGSYLYISEEKAIHREPGFWFRFIDYVDGAVSAASEEGIDGIEDHGMEHYLHAVKQWDLAA
ncbi:lipase family protein [Marinomonas sp. 2405UD68-3]|uniref:lipase family protein n=1 Tax=Marinomonas sp. 2405UD68-3 TaxID=3391835 RepID=UPI0039C93B73